MVRKMNEGGLDFAALYPPTEEASDRLTWQPRPEARFGQQRVVGDRIALQELPCLGEKLIALSRDPPWHEPVSQSCKTHVTRSRPTRRLTAVRAFGSSVNRDRGAVEDRAVRRLESHLGRAVVQHDAGRTVVGVVSPGRARAGERVERYPSASSDHVLNDSRRGAKAVCVSRREALGVVGVPGDEHLRTMRG